MGRGDELLAWDECLKIAYILKCYAIYSPYN